MKTSTLQLILILIVSTVNNSFERKFPSYIKLCHRDETDLNSCILKAVEALKPHLEEGIPQLFIPPINPFVIPKVTMNSGRSFNVTFENIKIFNTHNFTIKKIDVQLAKNKLKLEVYFPLLRTEASYKMKGKLLIFQLNSEGIATGNYTDGYATIEGQGRREVRKGKEYMVIVDQKLNLEFGKMSLYFSNLFPGNEELTNHINQAINGNMKEIMSDFYPVVREAAHGFLFSFVGEIFRRIPLDTLFPKS